MGGEERRRVLHRARQIDDPSASVCEPKLVLLQLKLGFGDFPQSERSGPELGVCTCTYMHSATACVFVCLHKWQRGQAAELNIYSLMLHRPKSPAVVIIVRTTIPMTALSGYGYH